MKQELSSSAAAAAHPSKGLNIGLWVVQVLLAVGFGMSGAMKLVTPYEQLASQAWARATPQGLIPFIGVAEVAGALGMILPMVTRIKPILTPIAALGFVVIMILGAAVHLKVGEMPIPNVVLGGLAAFVAWGRLK